MVSNDYIKDLFYVDYCNCCKDLDVMDPKEVPCHHPWYCWMDNGKVQDLEFRLGTLYEHERVNGYLLPSEKELLYQLKQEKFKIVKENLREYRKQLRLKS